MIGEEVRRRREELGLTGAQLALRADMAPSAVSQIETGKRTPNSTSVIKLAAALGVEVADLFPKGQVQLPFEYPVPDSLEEALEWAGASTRLLALPRKEFEELYADATPEEVARLNQDLVQEQQLIKPILYQWRTMPASEERSKLYALWQESLIRMLTATNAAEMADANAAEMAQELVSA